MNQLNWTEAQNKMVGDLIAEEVEKARLSHKFIPELKLAEDARSVTADEFDAAALTVDDVKTIALVEIHAPVNLTRLQAEDADLSAALLLVRRAANLLARAHDSIVFMGQDDANKPPKSKFPNDVVVTAGFKNQGLSAAGGGTEPVVANVKKGEAYGEMLVPAVAKALVKLEDSGYVGSYVLILGQTLYEDANTPTKGSLVLPTDRLEKLIGGAVFRSSVLSDDEGLLLSLGGDPMDRAIAVAPKFEFLRIGDKELRQCRVFERFALRLKEQNSVIKLVRK